MQHKLIQFLEKTEQEQFRLLKELITQSSHTLDKEGVDKVGNIICDALSGCDLLLSVEKMPDRGNNLIFRSSACRENVPHILLLGHMDTVFPQESSFNSYKEDAVKAYGPGIIDMKGGLVTAIFLIKALQSENLLSTVPLVFICNSDEEMGSAGSTSLIQREASGSLCGLVFECGGQDGGIVTGRKGKSGYCLQVFGKAGHAAFTGKNGKASAILELAHKTILIEQLNDPSKGIVVNVGRVEGGAAANIVAEKATAEIDIRFATSEDGDFCKNSIDAILSQSSVPGTQTTLTATSSRYPMEQSQRNLALFKIVKSQAELLSIEVSPEFRSGVSDANTIAECGIPVIDGLGPIGDFDHSENEYMEKDTLLSRCKLATLSTLEIWRRQARGEFTL